MSIINCRHVGSLSFLLVLAGVALQWCQPVWSAPLSADQTTATTTTTISNVTTTETAATATAGEPSAGASATAAALDEYGMPPPSQEELALYEQWKKSPLFVAPFDPKTVRVPREQLEFRRRVAEDDFALFKQILHEAIEGRNKMAPAMSLMYKFSGKILGNLIKNRRKEQAIRPKMEAKPEFFHMVASLAQEVIDKSQAYKKERQYSKKTVDLDEFQHRVEALLDYLLRIVKASPLGLYLDWRQVKLYADEPANKRHQANFIEEAADLLAQFRALGYDNTMFFMKRFISLIKLFSKGVVPAENEV